MRKTENPEQFSLFIEIELVVEAITASDIQEGFILIRNTVLLIEVAASVCLLIRMIINTDIIQASNIRI